MASSSIVSTVNHLSTQDRQQHTSLEEIYHNLQNVFANESFGAFKQKCKQVILHPGEYPKPLYSPIKFDSTKHAISSTTAKDYLNCLSDDDPNADLKSLTPAEIFNDGSVLFRAVASLLGFSLDEDARELRLRCLLDALSNLTSYVNDYEEILEPLLYPDKAGIKQWSNFVQEKDRMDAPNVITVLTLIVLAKVINIPIRSVYPIPSTEELNENPDHMYKLLNQVFYPPRNQCHGTENIAKPITILWWYTKTTSAPYPDIVIPLFPMDQHDVEGSACPISSGKSNIARPLNMNCNSSVVRHRGTFILIVTTVSDSKAYSTQKRIDDMKVAIIQLMKTVAATARPNDIIEVDTCDEDLTQPPLIPFCEATKVAAKRNLDLINTIKFRKATRSNLSICISAALDKLARQAVYYTDFVLFVDNLTDCTVKNSVEKSVLRVLRESRTISSQMIVSSEESIDQNERFESPGILQVDYLHSNNNNVYSHRSSDNIRHQIIVLYERNRSSQEVEKLMASTVSTSNPEGHPVLMNTPIRFVETKSSTPTSPEQHPADHVRSSSFSSYPLKVLIERRRVASSSDCYPRPAAKPKPIVFKPGFS